MEENDLKVDELEVNEGELENYLKREDYLKALDKYFETYPGFFKNNVSKGIFLLGVATGKLLRAQRKRFKSNKNLEPFWNSLYNLTLNRKRILKIHSNLITKLKYYTKYTPYPRNLIRAISKYLMKSGDDFNLTNLEISWFFSHGLASFYEVTNKNLIKILNQKNIEV
ncbi:MAG: TM1802 family CRISPR-associated protein [Candidatus Lokiarchaeota archaeon]